MPEITFDASDGADTSSQEAAQAQALEVGEKLIAEQEAAAKETYEKARSDEESQLRFAGKFKSAEDLEKAYKELERKLGQAKSEDESSDDGDESADEEVESTSEEADDAGEAAPATELLTKATEEFYSESGLSEETLSTLKQLSSEELVDAYVELQKNAPVAQPISNEKADEIINSVGGKESYQRTLEWAAENLTPEEVAAYDEVIATGSEAAVRLAAQALTLRAKYEGGFEGGNTVSGKAVKNQGPKGFKSQAELARAISNPKYREDPAYRQEIAERLANSGDLL